jgi:hypothetical protein
MAIQYVARNAMDAICYASPVRQPGYNDEALDDATSAELQAFLAVPVPAQVTNAQFKRQLDADGKLASALAAVQGAGGLTLELWYGATFMLRADPDLTTLATAIGYDSAALDTFFRNAAKL